MLKFSAILLSAVSASLLAAAPAQAAPYGDGHRYSAHGEHHVSYGYVSKKQASQLQRDILRLDNRIDRAYAKRQISRREATGLQRDATSLQRLFAHYKRGGLTRQEANVLDARLARMDRALHFESRDFNRRRG